MRNEPNIPCILCGGAVRFLRLTRERRYYQCGNCSSVMLDPADYISLREEKKRYELHNNDVDDPRYQKFVSPLVEQVLLHHTPYESGLDFGAGTGPVITKMLREKEYRINTWDPFFDDDRRLFESTYHYIVCSEVVEHFHRPAEEFKKLRGLLRPGAILYCMTELYTPDINFEKWGYKNDETHVIFYHRDALEWIRADAGFSSLEIHHNKLFALKA